MQSISRFLAVLIALVFLIGPLTGIASAHEGDHDGDSDYGSLTLTRQDSLGDTVHALQTMRFGFSFTQSGDHPVQATETFELMVGGAAAVTVPASADLTVGSPGRVFDYTVPEATLLSGDSRTVTLYLQYTYTPDGDPDGDGDETTHDEQTVKSNEFTITLLPALSNVATLDGVTLSDVTLVETFETATTRYTANVNYDVMETTVTADTTHDGATYTVSKGDDTYEDGVVPLMVGANPIVVTVTAENGSTPGDNTNVYTVTVTRTGAPIMDGVTLTFMATVPDDLPATLPSAGTPAGDDPEVSFEIMVTTGEHAITTAPGYAIDIIRYRGDSVISRTRVAGGPAGAITTSPAPAADTTATLGTLGSNAEKKITVSYTLTQPDLDADSFEFVFKTAFDDDTFGFTGTDPNSEATRYDETQRANIELEAGETSTMPAAPASAPASSPAPAPAPAPVSAPAMAGPPAPLGEIGRSSSAIATVLAGDVLLIDRTDGGADLRIGIGWTATDDSSQVLVGFIRDAGLGQTYAVVRREDDGMVVRRWIEPDSADVYAVPWADVNANYTVPTDVIITIPLDERHPAQLMLARRFDGGDDRIFVHVGNGVWSHIPDYNTFIARGFLWRNVTAADSDFFNRINEGPALPSSGG